MAKVSFSMLFAKVSSSKGLRILRLIHMGPEMRVRRPRFSSHWLARWLQKDPLTHLDLSHERTGLISGPVQFWQFMALDHQLQAAPGPEQTYSPAIKRHRSPPRLLGQPLTSTLIQNKSPNSFQMLRWLMVVLGTSQIPQSWHLSSATRKNPGSGQPGTLTGKSTLPFPQSFVSPASKTDLKLGLSQQNPNPLKQQ